MTPNSNSAENFVQCTYPKFHHPMFTRSEVIMLTHKQTNIHKQTPLKTSHACRYATTLGKHSLLLLLLLQTLILNVAGPTNKLQSRVCSDAAQILAYCP